jgi:hypothetical protein
MTELTRRTAAANPSVYVVVVIPEVAVVIPSKARDL